MSKINNRDAPAAPTMTAHYRYTGLTKREAFAMAAMQGILSSEHAAGVRYSEIASSAVGLADALLEELENPND